MPQQTTQPEADDDAIELPDGCLLPVLIAVDVLRRAHNLSPDAQPTDAHYQAAMDAFLHAAASTAASALHLVGAWPDAHALIVKFGARLDLEPPKPAPKPTWFDPARYAPAKPGA